MTDAGTSLDRIASYALNAQKNARAAGMLIARANQQHGGLEDAQRFANAAGDDAARVSAGLTQHGAIARPLPVENAIDIFQLDTPDVRELLALMEKALPVAERIDAARGRTFEGTVPEGDSRGIDLAQDVIDLVARLRLEIYGPSIAQKRE